MAYSPCAFRSCTAKKLNLLTSYFLRPSSSTSIRALRYFDYRLLRSKASMSRRTRSMCVVEKRSNTIDWSLRMVGATPIRRFLVIICAAFIGSRISGRPWNGTSFSTKLNRLSSSNAVAFFIAVEMVSALAHRGIMTIGRRSCPLADGECRRSGHYRACPKSWGDSGVVTKWGERVTKFGGDTDLSYVETTFGRVEAQLAIIGTRKLRYLVGKGRGLKLGEHRWNYRGLSNENVRARCFRRRRLHRNSSRRHQCPTSRSLRQPRIRSGQDGRRKRCGRSKESTSRFTCHGRCSPATG